MKYITIEEACKKYSINRKTLCARAALAGIDSLNINNKSCLPEYLAAKPVRHTKKRTRTRTQSWQHKAQLNSRQLFTLSIITQGLHNVDFSRHYGFNTAQRLQALLTKLPNSNGRYNDEHTATYPQ